jgi:hypothetical protein
VFGTTTRTKKIIHLFLLIKNNKYVGILIAFSVVFGNVNYHLRVVISGVG